MLLIILLSQEESSDFQPYPTSCCVPSESGVHPSPGVTPGREPEVSFL